MYLQLDMYMYSELSFASIYSYLDLETEAEAGLSKDGSYGTRDRYRAAKNMLKPVRFSK